jgi:hypothetical protein
LFPRWLSGLVVSLIGGWAAIQLFFWYLKRKMGNPPTDPSRVHVPAELTGFIERTFFMVLIGASGSLTTPWIVPLMFAWSAAKIGANWGRKDAEPAYPNVRAWTIRALLANLISMFFALVGGWIIIGPGKQ